MSRLSDRYAQGHVVLGTYASFGTAREVEILALAGLDFVRIDSYKHHWPDAVVKEMVAACRTHGITSWARTESDATEIARHVAMGVEALTVPSVDSAEQARMIVAAAAGGRAAGFLLGCQVESKAGLANLDEIVSVPGVDIIHSGRTDLAADIAPGMSQFDPQIVAAEEHIAAAAQHAGKAMALMYPLDARSEEFVAGWINRGVRIFALDNDSVVLRDTYKRFVTRLRGQ
jgi:4-hydroxy-2-oxoheptanedioate aldolase